MGMLGRNRHLPLTLGLGGDQRQGEGGEGLFKTCSAQGNPASWLLIVYYTVPYRLMSHQAARAVDIITCCIYGVIRPPCSALLGPIHQVWISSLAAYKYTYVLKTWGRV